MLSPLYGQLSPLRIPTKVAGLDPDALAYIAAVEAADDQALEEGVATAFTEFITGCKSDGIWSAIKASCILAGARTLSGALVPLVGTAPTNNNFVSADYNRETGLKGNGTTKYLDSNRSADSDPQNDSHISVWQSAASGGIRNLIACYRTTSSPVVYSGLATNGTPYYPRLNNSTASMGNQANGNTLGLFGATRSSSSNYQCKSGTGSVTTLNITSSAPPALNYYVFAGNSDGSLIYFHAGRLSFYSIGEDIDLTALNSRVSTLMTDLAAAI
jgi:hypothetical protein